MNADDFVALVRKGDGTLRLDDLVLDTRKEQFRGRGILRISRDQMRFEITLPDGGKLPDFQSGVFTVRDCWCLTGLIDEELRFRCARVFPSYSQHSTLGADRFTFDLSDVELIPAGWDTLTHDERDEQIAASLRRADINQPSVASQLAALAARARPTPITSCFHAVLANYPLLTWNASTDTTEENPFFGKSTASAGNIFCGELDGWQYALIEDKSGPDLHLHTRCAPGVLSVSEEADRLKFSALLRALAFVHGVHAWPYRTEYWRGGKKILDTVKCARELASTQHTPFSRGLALPRKGPGLVWEMGQPIRLLTTFFEQDTKLSREVGGLLARFREADDGKHPELTVLALCTLLENLIHLIFKERNLEPWAREQFLVVKKFEAAKQELIQYVGLQIPVKGEGYSRMKSLLSHAQAFYIGEKFQAVVKHLGLQWEDDFDRHAKAWKITRNDLVHEVERMDMSEDEIKQVWFDESRVAGIINALVLKLVGYSGPMRFSQHPEEHRLI